MTQTPPADPGSILLIGASRGLGLAMAAAFAARGWTVVATVRGTARTRLHDLAESLDRADSPDLAESPAADRPGRIEIERLDITDDAERRALSARLAGRVFDILFVNAGISNNPAETIADVSTEEFVRVMVTNALSPMRTIEALAEHVRPDGLIGVMSSGQGSVANNENGQREVYRGSKAALNMFMRSYAARVREGGRSLVLMAPGWVRTELGGPEGRLSIEESVPSLVAVILAQRGRPGLRYLDYLGRVVPW